MATKVEVAAARLYEAVLEAKNEPVEDWVRELAATVPNGVEAYTIDNNTP